MSKKKIEKIECYLRAIWLWANLWSVDGWNATEEKALDGEHYVDCETAWEVARWIWLK